MIPRTKVNYGLLDLARAALVRESGALQRDALLAGLNEYLGQRNIVLAPSGRGGLYVLLKTCDKPKVVVPTYTCKAVVEAAKIAGKEVCYVRGEKEGFNLDPFALAGVVDEHCCVLATHQFGIPCNIVEVLEVCNRAGACVIEDAAAALGTRVGGKLVGTFGDAGFFSFDSSKLVTVPLKGGFVVTKSEDWYRRIEALAARQFEPMPPRYKALLLAQAATLVMLENPWLYRAFHKLMFDWRGRTTTEGPALDLEETPFYRYGLAEWQARIAAKQVRRLPELVEERRKTYATLRERLASCGAFELPPADVAGEWAPIRFPLRVKGDKFAFYRRGVKRGIDFAFSFTFLACPGQDPNADALAASVLDIPYYSKLSGRELDQVVDALKSIDSEVVREAP